MVPKKHIRGLKEAAAEDAEIIGRCHLAAARVARERGIENGYRTVLNVGPGAGQSVFHLHVHLLGGRDFEVAPRLDAGERPAVRAGKIEDAREPKDVGDYDGRGRPSSIK